MKTSVKLLLAFATAAAAIAPAAAQQVVAWDEAYRQADARMYCNKENGEQVL